MNIWTSLKRLIILSWGYGIVMMRLKDGFYMELEMKHINVYSITDHEDKRGWEIDSAKAMKEKAMAPHSSIFAWKIPWMEEPGRLQSMGSLRVGHDWASSLSLFTFMHWRRKWQPTPAFLPGESKGQGSLVGCHLWSLTELDTTEET